MKRETKDALLVIRLTAKEKAEAVEWAEALHYSSTSEAVRRLIALQVEGRRERINNVSTGFDKESKRAIR